MIRKTIRTKIQFCKLLKGGHTMSKNKTAQGKFKSIQKYLIQHKCKFAISAISKIVYAIQKPVYILRVKIMTKILACYIEKKSERFF